MNHWDTYGNAYIGGANLLGGLLSSIISNSTSSYDQKKNRELLQAQENKNNERLQAIEADKNENLKNLNESIDFVFHKKKPQDDFYSLEGGLETGRRMKNGLV